MYSDLYEVIFGITDSDTIRQLKETWAQFAEVNKDNPESVFTNLP